MLLLLAALLACASVLSATETGDLVLVQLVHRHGDRGPQLVLPADTKFDQHWPLGDGELTGHGMVQEYYHIGKLVHAQYVETGFLSERFDASQYVVRSSNVHRTLQSAASALAAVYPLGTAPIDTLAGIRNDTPANLTSLPGRFQPVPVATVPKDQDTLLLGANYAKQQCPRTMALFADWRASDEFAAKAAESADLLARVSDAVGTEVDMANFGRVYDAIFCDKYHEFDSFPISDADYAALHDLESWYLDWTVNNDEMMTVWGGELMRTFVDQMQDAIAAGGKQDERFFHYSAHDVTVIPVGNTLGIYTDAEIPPYASNVILELFTRPGTAAGSTDVDDYLVVAKYTGEAREMRGPCAGDVVCPASKFLSYFGGQFRALGDETVAQFCGESSSPTPTPAASPAGEKEEGVSSKAVLYILGAATGVLLIAVVLQVCFIMRSRANAYSSALGYQAQVN